ncbi:MAG: hypothetical protein ACRCXC_09215 [Legionella sp.]
MLHREQNQRFFAQFQERVPNQALKELDRFKDVQYHIILLVIVLGASSPTSHYALLIGVALILCNLLCHRSVLNENEHTTARVDTELSTALTNFYQ